MKQQLNITIGICTLICMLISACKREKFSSFENGEIHYQIFKNKDCVLRAVNTDGEGVRKLELFSNEGRLVDEITIENEPFEISKF